MGVIEDAAAGAIKKREGIDAHALVGVEPLHAGLAPSKGQARNDIEGGGAYVNNLPCDRAMPHRTLGPVTEWMMEPIYCGAYHPASNICTFCPGREYMTLNFTMEQRHLDQVDRIETLLAATEAEVLEKA